MLFRILTAIFLLISPVLSEGNNDSLTVVMAGDLMIGSWGREMIADKGEEYPVRNLKGLFKNDYLTMCNLEAPFTVSGDKFPDKMFTFKVPPEYVSLLSKLGLDYVTLANNHIMDFGGKGLQETMEVLRAEGISFSGAGNNESAALQPAIIDFNGFKVGLIGCGAVFPEEFWATDSTAGIFFPWKEKLIKTIRETRSKVDYLFIAFHWGAEKREIPKQYQKGLARLCINNGADMVWGHHPHVIQGVELYKNRPIFYSLGNFIFASYSQTANGMAVKVIFKNRKLRKIELFPLDLDNFNVPLQPSLLSDTAKSIFIHKVNALSDSIAVGNIQFNENGVFLQTNH